MSVVERDGGRRELPYDRLVLAAGSKVVRPMIDGAEHLFDVDTLPSAAALHSHIQRLRTRPAEAGTWTVVVGAGFTGIDAEMIILHADHRTTWPTATLG